MTQGFRLAAATGLHKGDRPYQQDQVLMMSHWPIWSECGADRKMRAKPSDWKAQIGRQWHTVCRAEAAI